MIPFNHQVLSLISDFYRKNGYAPNEIWLGYFGVAEMELFCEKYHITTTLEPEPDIYTPIYKKKKTFMGLKVRYTNDNSKTEVKYNPHYE